MEISKDSYDEVRGFVINMVVKQALKVLLTKIPWFGSFSPALWVATKLLTKFITFLVDETALGINLIMIQLQVDGQVEEVEAIIDRFKHAETEEQKDVLEKELIEASRSLIRLRDEFRLPIDSPGR
jgi:hypothetical protein